MSSNIFIKYLSTFLECQCKKSDCSRKLQFADLETINLLQFLMSCVPSPLSGNLPISHNGSHPRTPQPDHNKIPLPSALPSSPCPECHTSHCLPAMIRSDGYHTGCTHNCILINLDSQSWLHNHIHVRHVDAPLYIICLDAF